MIPDNLIVMITPKSTSVSVRLTVSKHCHIKITVFAKI